MATEPFERRLERRIRTGLDDLDPPSRARLARIEQGVLARHRAARGRRVRRLLWAGLVVAAGASALGHYWLATPGRPTAAEPPESAQPATGGTSGAAESRPGDASESPDPGGERIIHRR